MKRISLLAVMASIAFFSLAQTAESYNDLASEAFKKKNYQLVIEYSGRSISLSPNGTAYWNRGSAYYNLNRFTEAKSDYTLALIYYTDATSLGKLYRYRAESNIKLGDYQSASDDLKKLASYTIDDYGSYYWDLGAIAYNMLNYTEAEIQYKKALPYYVADIKEKARLYNGIGDCNHSLKNNTGALKNYTTSIEVDPGNIYAYKARAIVFAENSNYKKAIEDTKKIIDYSTEITDKDKNYYYTKMAEYAWYANEYDEGLNYASEALKYSTTYNQTYWYISLLYDSQMDYRTALEYNQQAIILTEKESDLAILYRNRSLLDKKLLQYRNALNDLNTAIKYDKENNDAYWTKAQVYTNRKEYAAALNEYEKALSLFTDSASLASLYRERALVWQRTKDHDRAFYDMRRSLEYNNSTYTKYRYGRMLIESGTGKNIIEGKKVLEDVIEQDIKLDTCADYSYAKVLLGDSESAINNTLRLLDKYRINKLKHLWELYNLACIYSLSGRQEKAIEYLEKTFSEGFNNFEQVLNDEDLITLRNNVKFKLLMVKYKMPAIQF
jgi:tetratricopeptide (TPR) repeat protein